MYGIRTIIRFIPYIRGFCSYNYYYIRNDVMGAFSKNDRGYRISVL